MSIAFKRLLGVKLLRNGIGSREDFGHCSNVL